MSGDIYETQHTKSEERFSSLKLTIGYNKSDSTYGFSGSSSLFDIYFLHYPLEYSDSSVGHKYSLSTLMIPEVTIKLETTTKLGLPYTQCSKEEGYTKSFCEFSALMAHIVHVCGCVPEYVPNIKAIVKNYTKTRACNYYEHGTCVSYVRSYFDPDTIECLPACTSSKYVTSKIQVFDGIKFKNYLKKLFSTLMPQMLINVAPKI